MRRIFQLSVIILLLGLLQVQAQTAEIIAPNIFLRGMELPQETRYTATFIRPTSNFLMRSVSVEVTLPVGVEFKEMLVSDQVGFNVIRVDRAGALTLIWQISRVESATPFDAFAFTVAQPLSSEVEFYIEWLDEAGQKFVQNFREIPPLTNATETDGSIFPVLDSGLVPVGNTGVQLASNSVESLIGVRVLPNDFNPPAEFGDIWWCSLLEVTGLADGLTAEVIVPLRRPVAPFTSLDLFQQQIDGSWAALPNKGIVTADGQFVKYTHPGGLVASGGDPAIEVEVIPVAEIPVEAPSSGNEPQWGEVASQNSPPSTDGLSDQLGNANPPVENIPDGTSNTVFLGESGGQDSNIPPSQDGAGNNGFLGDPAGQFTPAAVQDGTSNTVFLGESGGQDNGISPTQDGTSNTAFLGENTGQFTPAAVQDVASNPVFLNDTSGQFTPTAVPDGVSNTVFLGETGNQFTPTAVSDGTSNTVFLGENTGQNTANAFTPTPVPNGGVIFAPTPGAEVAQANVGTAQDGTSNTVFLSEQPASNNTPSTDTLSGNQTTSNEDGNITLDDGSTIFLGDDVATAPQTTDGTSNTVFVQDATPEAEEEDAEVITIVVDDLNGLGVQVSANNEGVTQCQLGNLICVRINRGPGTR